MCELTVYNITISFSFIICYIQCSHSFTYRRWAFLARKESPVVTPIRPCQNFRSGFELHRKVLQKQRGLGTSQPVSPRRVQLSCRSVDCGVMELLLGFSLVIFYKYHGGGGGNRRGQLKGPAQQQGEQGLAVTWGCLEPGPTSFPQAFLKRVITRRQLHLVCLQGQFLILFKSSEVS